MTTVLKLARDFSKSPSGRVSKDGPSNGQRFRDEFLFPALEKGDVEVILDGVLTLGSSFLEEAFGGLVREKGLTPSMLRKKLVIQSRVSTYKDKIWSYIDQSSAKKTQ